MTKDENRDETKKKFNNAESKIVLSQLTNVHY